MSADIMASLRGVRGNDFSSKTTRPRDMLFFMSAHIMASLCGICIHMRVRVNIFSSKSTRLRDMLLLLKDTLTIEDYKIFQIDADLSVRLFPRAIRSEVPPPKE